MTDCPGPLVEIDAVAAGGAGVGRLPDGRAVFVHRTAPGDRVRIEVTRERARWATGRVVDLLSPGEGRRAAPCPHYGRCGGCTLEHLRYRHQLQWKGRIVAEALGRIGGVEAKPPRVEPSPAEFRYRSRVSFHLRRLPGGRVVAGFHELERPGRIVDLGGSCLLPEEPLARTWDALRAAWGPGAARLPAGRALRLTLRQAAEGAVLLVEDEEGGRGGEGGRVRPGATAPDGDPDALLAATPGLRAVWRREGRAPRPRLLAGEAETVEGAFGQRVRAGAAAFVQVNREAAALLHAHVLRQVGPPRGLRVVDAYCGVGAWGRRLAGHGAVVVGIERDPAAVEAARDGGPPGWTVLEGTVEARLAEALPADLVLVNPPRGGLHQEVPARLVAAGVPRVVYVSCDPATLARDLSRLGAAYRLGDLAAFDLFPQTAHVETVAVLERGEAGP